MFGTGGWGGNDGKDPRGYDRKAMHERERKRKIALKRGNARDIALTAPVTYEPCLLLADDANPPIDRSVAEGAHVSRGSVLDELERERKAEREAAKNAIVPSAAEALFNEVLGLEERGAFGTQGDPVVRGALRALLRGMPGRTLVPPVTAIMNELDLSNRSLGNDFAATVAKFLRLAECPLTSVNLSNTRMSTEGAQALGDALRGNRILSSLTLITSPIPVQMVRGNMEDGFFEDTRLDLSDRQYEALDAVVIGALMNENDVLDALDISGNAIVEQSCEWGKQGARYVGLLNSMQAMLKLGSITALDVGGNALMQEGLSIVCQLITNSDVLKECGLGGNMFGLNSSQVKVTGHGIEALAQSLLAAKCLTSLDLSDNLFDGNDIEMLCGTLRVQNTLLTLDLSQNPMGAFGGAAVADFLCDNQMLKSLQLKTCRIADLGFHHVAKALQSRNRRLTALDLRDNHATEPGAQAMLDALNENPVLTDLLLDIDVDANTGVLDEGNPIVAQVVALAAANADFLAMIADPEHVDFSKMSMAGKLNVFRKHKYIDVVRPGASRILLEKNESFRKQVIKGHKTPLHYFADMGERQMVRDLAAMWDVPRPLWLREELLSTKRERAIPQRLRSVVSGYLLSLKLLMWERFRAQLNRCIDNYKHPTPFKFGPAIVPGFQCRVHEWPDDNSEELGQLQAGPMILNGEPMRACADYGDWLEIRYEDPVTREPYHHAFTRRVARDDGRVILMRSERKPYTNVCQIELRLVEDLYVKKAYSPENFDAHVQLSLRKALAAELTTLFEEEELDEGRVTAEDIDIVEIGQATRIMRSRLVNCGVEVVLDCNFVEPDCPEVMQPWAEQLKKTSEERKALDNHIRKQIVEDQKGKSALKFQLDVKASVHFREFVLEEPGADEVTAQQRESNVVYVRRQFVEEFGDEEVYCATQIQKIQRGIFARARAKRVLHRVWEKVFSEEFAAFYYVNHNAEQGDFYEVTSWRKPRMLGKGEDLGPADDGAARFRVRSKIPQVDPWAVINDMGIKQHALGAIEYGALSRQTNAYVDARKAKQGDDGKLLHDFNRDE